MGVAMHVLFCFFICFVVEEDFGSDGKVKLVEILGKQDGNGALIRWQFRAVSNHLKRSDEGVHDCQIGLAKLDPRSITDNRQTKISWDTGDKNNSSSFD